MTVTAGAVCCCLYDILRQSAQSHCENVHNTRGLVGMDFLWVLQETLCEPYGWVSIHCHACFWHLLAVFNAFQAPRFCLVYADLLPFPIANSIKFCSVHFVLRPLYSHGILAPGTESAAPQTLREPSPKKLSLCKQVHPQGRVPYDMSRLKDQEFKPKFSVGHQTWESRPMKNIQAKALDRIGTGSAQSTIQIINSISCTILCLFWLVFTLGSSIFHRLSYLVGLEIVMAVSVHIGSVNKETALSNAGWKEVEGSELPKVTYYVILTYSIDHSIVVTKRF